MFQNQCDTCNAMINNVPTDEGIKPTDEGIKKYDADGDHKGEVHDCKNHPNKKRETVTEPSL